MKAASCVNSVVFEHVLLISLISQHKVVPSVSSWKRPQIFLFRFLI